MTAPAGVATYGNHTASLWRRGYRLLRSGIRLFIGIILCLTPVTAILVLGWLMRMMAREERFARARLSGSADPSQRPTLPAWFVCDAPGKTGVVARWIGSLRENIRMGCAAFVTVAAATLPFTLLWLFSWWAGWENSFNKGYEQAWIGPTLGLLGVAISLPLLARLPMALAHQAATGSTKAFFAIFEVRGLIRLASWRYVWLSILFVAAALPLSIVKVAPVFIEHWRPGFSARSPAEIAEFADAYRFWATVYVLLALIYLRRASARLHARAALKRESRPASSKWSGAGNVLRSLLLWLIWFGFVAQLYVTQFLNHQWTGWLSHPLILLPWLPPLGTSV